MALFDSKTSVFQIVDIGGTLRDVSAYIKSIDGLPGGREMKDVTALGDAGRMHKPVLENVTIKLELMWSTDANVGPETIFGPLRTHTAATAFDYGLDGKTVGKVKYSGNCWVAEWVAPMRVGELTMGMVTMPVNGVVTRGTYA